MGQMRFSMPRSEQLSAAAVDRAYLAGMEGIPWRSRNLVQQQQLLIERSLHESGNLYIPWNVREHGEVVLSTASLMEGPRVYQLPLELARGTLTRLRNFAAEVQQAGLVIPEQIQAQIDQAHQQFIRCATTQNDPAGSAELADRVLEVCLKSMEQLAQHCAQQTLDARRRPGPPLHTLLAVELSRTPDIEQARRVTETFNAVALTTTWREIEPNAGQYSWTELEGRLDWCQQQGLRICAGPLLRTDREALPDWVYLWDDDFDQLQSCISDFITAVVQRFAGRVHIWHAAAGLNVGGELTLSEEQRLRLAVNVIESVRRGDSQTPLVMSFDQPWAEYLAKDDFDLSPIHFADALARADLGVAGIGLELNMGYTRAGTLPRDLLEISRQIDRWSYLGLPLLVSLVAPSDCGPDPLAWQKTETFCEQQGAVTAESQREWIERVIALLLSKSAVHGIIWNQLSDALPHAFPHGGLWDHSGQPKPALDSLAQLRKRYLT